MIGFRYSAVSTDHLLTCKAVELQLLVEMLLTEVLVRVLGWWEGPRLTDIVQREELVAAKLFVLLVHFVAKLANRYVAAVAVGHGGFLQLHPTLAAEKLPLRHHRRVDVDVLDQVDVVKVGKQRLDAAFGTALGATGRALDHVWIIFLRLRARSTSSGLGVHKALLAKRVEAGKRLGHGKKLPADDTREFFAHSLDGGVFSLLVDVSHGHDFSQRWPITMRTRNRRENPDYVTTCIIWNTPS